MKKKKQPIYIRIFKALGYAVTGLIVLVVLVLYSQTTESKSFSGYDYAIIIGGIMLVYLITEVDGLKDKIEELESRLDDLKNEEEDYFEEY